MTHDLVDEDDIPLREFPPTQVALAEIRALLDEQNKMIRDLVEWTKKHEGREWRGR